MKVILTFLFLVTHLSSFANDISFCGDHVLKKVEKIYSHLDNEKNSLDRSRSTVSRLAMETILDVKNDYICKEQEAMLDDVAKIIDLKL